MDKNEINVSGVSSVEEGLSGQEGNASLIGQAVSVPSSEGAEIISVSPGQEISLDFPADAATPSVDGTNFVLSFDEDGDGVSERSIVFENLVGIASESSAANMPTLIVGGVEVPADQLIEQVIALASEAALETAAGAAAGPQGGGGSSYNDDLGSVIGLLDAQDGLDGTDGGPLDGVGFETVVPDPAEGVFTLSFLSAATVVPVVDSLEGAGISGTFAGGFEDALPNQNLDLDGDQQSEGDLSGDDNPFDSDNADLDAQMQLVFTFAPADNETLDSVTLAGIEGFDGSGDAGTTRLFVGGFGPEFEVTALPVIITPENFGSVFILPAKDSDNDIDVSGSAQISDPDSGATASLLFAETAIVDAVADVPVLTDEFAPSQDEEPVELQRSVSAGDSNDPVLLSSGENALVKEESLVRVPINAQLRDVDGSEVLTITVSGVPNDFTLNSSSSFLPTGWEIQPAVAGEDGTTTYTLTFNAESGEGDATGLSGYLEFSTNDFTTQGVAAEDDNEGGSEDSIPDDQDVLRVASTEPDADAGRNNDGAVNDGAPVTITVTATAEEVNLDGGELTPDNNVSSASLDFTFEIAEDIPDIIPVGNDGFTLTHDETPDAQPDTNDQDSSAQIGVIGTAAIAFNYSFRTDAALDEQAGDDSDGVGAATDGQGATDGLENLAFDLNLSSINGLAAVDGSADGSAITLSANRAGDVLEGRDEGGALVFTVSLQRDAAEETNNEDTNEGGLVFTQFKAIRHTDTNADNETENFSVTLRITDDEGDTSTQSFTINVNDDAPTIDNPVDFAASDRDDAVVIDREPNGLTRPSRPPQEISRSTFFLNEEKNEAELSLRGSLARGNGTNINEDGYELQLKQGETLSLDASDAGNTNGLVIRIFTRSGGSYIQELQSVDGQLTYTAPSDDAYFIQVFNPNAGRYNLDVTISNPAGIAVLDEDGLTGGNAGAESGIDGDVAGEAVVATGSLGIDFGTDGPASSVIAPDGAISFAGLNGATAGFTVGGEAVTYAWDAGSLTLKALDSEGGEVFVLTVTSVVPSQYSIELKQSIDHPEAGAEDNVTLDLPFVATDGDGDTIEGSLKVAINDDSPENNDAQPISVLVREDGLGGGDLSDGNGRQDGGEFARIRVSDLETQVSVGADAPVTFAFNADLAGQAVVDGDGNPVTSNGAAVVYEVVRDGAGEVVGINGVADGRTVFEVTRRPNGDFRFDLDDQIDHPDDAANNDSQTLGLDLSSVFTATDSDGDTIVLDSAVTVNVEDDIPVTFGNLPVLLDDDNLSGGNPGGRGDNPFAPFHTSGVLNHSIGADEVATVALEGVQLPSGFSYELNEDKTEIEIRDGDVTVLTITLTDQQTGAYTVEQNAPVDHPAGRNENNLDFVVRYRVTDADNDYANGAILINVDDDTPVVSDEDRTGRRDWIKEKNLVGQESLSISGDLEFSPGADGGEITSVAFAGYEDTEDSDPYGSTITSGDKTVVFTQTVVDGDIVLSGTVDGGSTPVLTVTVDQATGAYSVELFKAIDHPDLSLEDDANDRDPLTLNFDYTVTDGDGDTSTATLSVVVEDEEADAHDVFAGTLNEADLSDGNSANDQLSGVLDVDANPDGIRVVGLRFEGWEDGEDGRPEGEVLRSGDQNVVFGDVTTNGDGDLVLVGTIDNGATDIITLVVDPDSFEYTITLNGPINHPDRSVDGSNLNDPLDLNFGFLTRDGDGDEDEETLTVTIQDDTPTVGSNTDLELSEVDDVSSASAVLAHDFGADGAGQLALTAVTVPEGFTSRSEANGSFTVLQNNVAVLSVALAANGEYTVTQIGEIFLNSNAAETFEFGVSYSVTDADDDVVNGSAGFNVEVQGDFEGSGVGIFLGVNSAGTGMSGFGRGILSDNDTSRGEIINDPVGFWIDGDEERDELNIDDFTDEDGVLTTTEQADYVFGDTSGNKVNLGGGNDQFDDRGGNSGADIVDGGEGRDTIWTGDNDDILIGGEGDDRLFGEAGNDILIGGEGDDRIYGASGEDTIVLNKAGDGVDRLIGFNANQDTLNISDILADNGVDETADISEFINVVQQNGNTVIQAKDADSGQFENVAVISNQSLDLDDLTVSKVDVDF